jgi:hypothetical protein
MALINEHTAFQAIAVLIRNELTLDFGIEKVLSGLEGDAVDKKLLEHHYAEFDHEYWNLVESGLKGDLSKELPSLIAEAKMLAADEAAVEFSSTILRSTMVHTRTNASQAEQLHYASSLQAYIFAYWTLEKSVNATHTCTHRHTHTDTNTDTHAHIRTHT